jgi:hypothetical protein
MNHHIVHISATLDVPNGCPMECRVNMKGEIEFSLGSWQGSIELLFDRYALQRFTELATGALTQPVPANPDAACSVVP